MHNVKKYLFFLLLILIPFSVNAQSVSGSSYYYIQQCPNYDCPSSYNSSLSSGVNVPTTTYTTIPKLINYGSLSSYAIKQIYLNLNTYTFNAGTIYTIKVRFDKGSYLHGSTSGLGSVDQDNYRMLSFCSNNGSTNHLDWCTISWDTSSNNAETWNATIIYAPQITGSSAYFQIGNYNYSHTIFLMNISPDYNQGIRISSIDVSAEDNGSNSIIANQNQNTQAIINNQNSNTTQITNSIDDVNDSLTDSTTDDNLASRFINLFSHNDHALASIVTAPLNFLNSLDDSCQPITIPFKLGGGNGCGGLPVCVNATYSKNATIQCGDTLFWNKSDVSDFRVFWNALFGGAIIYMLGFKLFKTINRALDPFVDDINGLEV